MFDEFTEQVISILYDADFFHIKTDRRGNVTDVSYDESDLDTYFYEEDIERIDLSSLSKFAELLRRVKFYKGYIELSDNRTMWDINNVNVDEIVYEQYIDIYVDEFTRKTNVEVFLLGRSGRHVCVDDDAYNIINYEYLKDVQYDLEKQFVAELNNINPDEDNF